MWPLPKRIERKSIVWEIKVLRKIYGLLNNSNSNECRIRTSYELELLFNKPDMLKVENKWVGHARRNQNLL